jgi:hypothetical protein
MLRKDTKLVCESYKTFIKSQRCLVCDSDGVDPDHLIATGQRQSKRNDFTLLPLCRSHHSQRHQIGNEWFESLYKLNLWKEATFLITEFLLLNSAGSGLLVVHGKQK